MLLTAAHAAATSLTHNTSWCCSCCALTEHQDTSKEGIQLCCALPHLKTSLWFLQLALVAVVHKNIPCFPNHKQDQADIWQCRVCNVHGNRVKKMFTPALGDFAASPCCVEAAAAAASWDVSVNPGHSRTSQHTTVHTGLLCNHWKVWFPLAHVEYNVHNNKSLSEPTLYLVLCSESSAFESAHSSRSQCGAEAVESGCEIQSRSPQSQLVN